MFNIFQVYMVIAILFLIVNYLQIASLVVYLDEEISYIGKTKIVKIRSLKKHKIRLDGGHIITL